MQLDILTPDKKIFSGEVTLVQVPGTKGSFEVLNNHAPIISTLSPGKMKIYMTGGEKNYFEILSDGVIEVKKNKIIILAEKLKAIKEKE
jgi:F-type H+-transporting ATPase subunit epsilon